MLFFKLFRLSEEAAFTCYEENKRFRQCCTRKIAKINCNTDLLHMLLVLSDPYYITSSMSVEVLKKIRRNFRRNSIYF